jgi:hypothetical protein
MPDLNHSNKGEREAGREGRIARRRAKGW